MKERIRNKKEEDSFHSFSLGRKTGMAGKGERKEEKQLLENGAGGPSGRSGL